AQGAATERAGDRAADAEPARGGEVRLGATLGQSRPREMAAPHHGADPRAVGQGGQAAAQRLCPALARARARRAGDDDRGLRSPATPGAGRARRRQRAWLHRAGGQMKFACFHLMPYRPLDLAAAKAYRSAWVVLPNSFYDPQKGAAEY